MPRPLARHTPQAARVRCTLGEISDALERAWGRHQASAGVSSGAYAHERGEEDADVAEVAAAVKQFEELTGIGGGGEAVREHAAQAGEASARGWEVGQEMQCQHQQQLRLPYVAAACAPQSRRCCRLPRRAAAAHSGGQDGAGWT